MQKSKLKWLPVILALVLPFLFFHYGFSSLDCDHDFCTTNRVLWGHNAEINKNTVVLRNLRTGQPVLENGKPIMVDSVRRGYVGIVIRDDTPTVIGWLGGVFAPILLLAIAGMIGIRTAKTSN